MAAESDKAQAQRMLDVFASVGVLRFDITHINIDGEKRGFRPAQTLEQTRRSMPYLVDSAAKRQNNVIVRPHSSTAYLVQLDDLDAGSIERVRPAAFLILATSPGNHQAWLAVEDADADFARRVRKGSGADLTASGATRVAGTANFKRKYEPDFPTVTILEAMPARTVTKDQLAGLGLVAPAEVPKEAPASPLRVSNRPRAKTWPSYERCLDKAPLARDGDRPDISRADFTWCMVAIDWGWSIEDTAAKLLQQSSKAKENGEQYAVTTAQNAAAAVARRRGHPKGLRT
jgi:hypothetical protein